MFGIGPPEFIAFLVIALLLFGNRLPGVMRSLGQGIFEFRDAVRNAETSTDKLS